MWSFVDVLLRYFIQGRLKKPNRAPDTSESAFLREMIKTARDIHNGKTQAKGIAKCQ